MLNEKQKMFCKEYVRDFNATQAAIRAGYSEKTARAIGTENLTKPDIQNEIARLTEKKVEKNEDLTQQVIDEFRKIAFSSIAHLHNTWISRKEFDEITDDQKACIESIKTRVRRMVYDKEDYEVEEVQIKLYDKQRALENLGKHLGIYEKDNVQKSDHSNTTDDELLNSLGKFAKSFLKTEG